MAEGIILWPQVGGVKCCGPRSAVVPIKALRHAVCRTLPSSESMDALRCFLTAWSSDFSNNLGNRADTPSVCSNTAGC